MSRDCLALTSADGRLQSGADKWTTEQRQKLANDLENPQLLAVTDNVNQEKSDSGPEEWKPPLGEHSLFYST